MPWLRCIIWEAGIENCTCGKCMHPSDRNRQLNQERYDVLSIPGCVSNNESCPWSQTWTIYAAVHVFQDTWNAEESPQAQTWWLQEHSGQMERRWQIPQVFVGYWMDWGTDHSTTMKSNCKTIPTLLHNKKEVGTRIHRNFDWTAEGFQGPFHQRSDFKEAKQTCERLCHEYTAITGSGNKPVSLQGNKSDKGLINSLKALKKTIHRLEASTGWRYYLSSTTHPSSCWNLCLLSLTPSEHEWMKKSRWQPSGDLRSIWSWDSWKSSSWTEQWIFL